MTSQEQTGCVARERGNIDSGTAALRRPPRFSPRIPAAAVVSLSEPSANRRRIPGSRRPVYARCARYPPTHDIHTRSLTHKYIPTLIHIHTPTYTNTLALIHIYTNAHTKRLTYIHTRTNTHTHTQIVNNTHLHDVRYKKIILRIYYNIYVIVNAGFSFWISSNFFCFQILKVIFFFF